MWEEVADQLGRFSRVLRYDRAGFGFSDPADPLRVCTVGSVAEELRAMLATIGARPPYVLVAHSLGALYINVLVQRLRPKDVCGIVYVDAASPETVRLLENIVPTASPPVWLARSLGWFGLLRLLAPIILRPYAAAFRGELKNEAMATWSRGDWLMAYTQEWTGAIRSIKGSSSSESLSFPPGWLGSTPIAVLVPDVYERTKGKAYIGGMQRFVTKYSSNATLIPVSDCGHFIQLERPDVVTDAVRLVIQRGVERDKNQQNSDDPTVPLISPE